MNKEDKLQAEMAVSFSQQRPEEHGNLWATLNRSLSGKDGQKQKAMGLIRGVSDLIYYKNNRFVGIEVKAPGQKHSLDHITEQYEWGVEKERNGGEYYIVTSLEGFWAVINDTFCSSVYHLEDIKRKIDEGKSTIVFF